MNKSKKFVAAASLVLAAVFTGQIPVIGSFDVVSYAAATMKLSAPSNLQVKDRTSSEITLQWGKVKGADAYRVYMYNEETDTFDTYLNTPATSCTVNKLDPETLYKFKVAGLVRSGGKYTEQKKSGTLSVKTKRLILDAPLNITTESKKNSIRLSWDAVKGAAGYRIYIKNEKLGEYEAYKTVTGTSGTVRDLEEGTAYKFRIVTLSKKDGKFIEHSKSAVIKAQTEETVLSSPKGIKFTSYESAIQITWNELSGASAYRIFMLNEENGEFEKYKDVSGTRCTVKELEPDTEYKFMLAALVKSNGKTKEQNRSNVISAKTQPVKMRTVPVDFVIPTGGENHNNVLRDCGIANYTSEQTDQGTVYYGDVLSFGVESKLYLYFDKNDRFYASYVYVPVTFDEYGEILSTARSTTFGARRSENVNVNGYNATEWQYDSGYTMSLYYDDERGVMVMYLKF